MGVPNNHPAYGKEYDSVDVEAHGGRKPSRPSMPCGKKKLPRYASSFRRNKKWPIARPWRTHRKIVRPHATVPMSEVIAEQKKRRDQIRRVESEG